MVAPSALMVKVYSWATLMLYATEYLPLFWSVTLTVLLDESGSSAAEICGFAAPNNSSTDKCHADGGKFGAHFRSYQARVPARRQRVLVLIVGLDRDRPVGVDHIARRRRVADHDAVRAV